MPNLISLFAHTLHRFSEEGSTWSCAQLAVDRSTAISLLSKYVLTHVCTDMCMLFARYTADTLTSHTSSVWCRGPNNRIWQKKGTHGKKYLRTSIKYICVDIYSWWGEYCYTNLAHVTASCIHIKHKLFIPFNHSKW